MTTPPRKSVATGTYGLLKSSLILSYRRNPIRPVGMNPIQAFMSIKKLFLISPKYQKATAPIAPICIATSKVERKSLGEIPRMCEVRIR